MLIPTVVIPTKNEERNISNVMDDLKNQTMKCKVIVADGNSEDNTVEIAKSYDAFVIIGKSTVGTARHWGTEHADSEFILQTDADARIPPDWVERHVANLEDNYIVTGPIIYPKERIASIFNPLFLFGQYCLMNMNVSCVAANMSFRKSRYVGFPDQGYGEDMIFLRNMIQTWGPNCHLHDNSIVVTNEHNPVDWWFVERGLKKR